jgi:phospholipase/carboxylesterase
MPLHGGYVWYAINFDADQNKFSDNEQAKSSRDLIAGFIDELILNYSIDAKVSLLGFSQGAILSYAIVFTSRKISKVIALSGYLNEELSKKIIGITISQN